MQACFTTAPKENLKMGEPANEEADHHCQSSDPVSPIAAVLLEHGTFAG